MFEIEEEKLLKDKQYRDIEFNNIKETIDELLFKINIALENNTDIPYMVSYKLPQYIEEYNKFIKENKNNTF